MRWGRNEEMAEFFPDLLKRFTETDFLKNVCRKYHYGESQIAELRTVAEEMLLSMCREAFWERSRLSREDGRRIGGGTDIVCEKVVISLGSGVDSLQDRYSSKERLTQSYMIEVLAGELLMQSYEAYNTYVREHTNLHVARYHFPGSEETFPLETLSDLLRGFTDKVICNAAFCMQPKKSVVFAAELTEDESVQCRGVCVGCNSMHCPNKLYSADIIRYNQFVAVNADKNNKDAISMVDISP